MFFVNKKILHQVKNYKATVLFLKKENKMLLYIATQNCLCFFHLRQVVSDGNLQ